MELTLGELARRVGGDAHGEPAQPIRRVATLRRAQEGDISFLANPRYRRYLSSTAASAVILDPQNLPACPVSALVTDNPYLAYARVAAILNPPPPPRRGVHPTAVVEAGAEVPESAWIGALCLIERGARIEADVVIGPGCIIGEDCVIGAGSQLVARVTLCRGTRVGRRTIIHPGVVIGADGFGIARDGERWVKVPQLGGVQIGDDVEIGANTTIDRGALDDTVVEDGVKIDNLVQVGHNGVVGAHTAIAGCVGISGSVHIGRRCIIGGAVGIGGHLELADDVHITGMSMVTKSVKQPGLYSSGIPLDANRTWHRNVARFRQLDDMAKRLKALEEELTALRSKE